MPNVLSAIAALLSAAVCISDLHVRRVPNVWLLAALLTGGLVLGVQNLQGHGASFLHALSGLLIGLVAMLPFYVVHWMGAGDVKFFAVLGFLLGPADLLPIWIIGSLLLGAHAFCVLLFRLRLRRSIRHPAITTPDTAVGLDAAISHRANNLPYAAYLAIGAIATIAIPGIEQWRLT